MLCKEIRKLAYFYLDGSVGSAKAERIGHHVEVCADCGTRVAIHRRIREVVRSGLKPVGAPEKLKERVRQTCRGCE